MSPQEFSQKIKAKYPQYQDVDDIELAQKIVEKYPVYKDQVKFETVEEPESGLDVAKTAASFAVNPAGTAMQVASKPLTPAVSKVASKLSERGQKVTDFVKESGKTALGAEQDLQKLGVPKPLATAGGVGLAGAELGGRLAGEAAGGAIDIIGEGISALAPQWLKDLAGKAGEAVINTPGAKETIKTATDLYNKLPENVKPDVEALFNTVSLLGGAKGATAVAPKVTEAAVKTTEKLTSGAQATREAVGVGAAKVGGIASQGVKGMVPAGENIVNHSVTRALNLTQGDVRNIKASTGNEVGRFLAERNLIGNSLDDTLKNTETFYKTNYKGVRDEIAKVKTTYTQDAIPRYTEALTEIQKQISGVAGLQKETDEVTKLLGKKKPTLEDVQRVKELMDEHFSLYKGTGDIKEGVAKAGLDNIRKDIKSFIEQEVKDSTGADIRAMNNNVATARDIIDATAARSTRGLTKAHISPGDWATFFAGTMAGGNPFVGAAAVLVKKIGQNPDFQLRFAKFMDKLSDGQKEKVIETLKRGEVPPEIEKSLLGK